MYVGQPELAQPGILRSGMEERDAEGGDAGERRCDVVYRPRCEAVGEQEDPDDAQRSSEDIPDLRVVVRAERGLDMSVNDPGEEQHHWQSQPDVPDNRSHVAVRQRWILTPRRFHGQHRVVPTLPVDVTPAGPLASMAKFDPTAVLRVYLPRRRGRAQHKYKP